MPRYFSGKESRSLCTFGSPALVAVPSTYTYRIDNNEKKKE
jgi:hypothetical protein